MRDSVLLINQGIKTKMKKEYSNLRCKDSIGERNLYCYDCELDDHCPFQKEGRNKIDSECKRWESLKKLYKELWK
jgi:hypothetical protein